jgi:hypothetical protein
VNESEGKTNYEELKPRIREFIDLMQPKQKEEDGE